MPDFNFGAPPENSAQMNNDFQFGDNQNEPPKGGMNDFNFEALPEIGNEHMQNSNFNFHNE